MSTDKTTIPAGTPAGRVWLDLVAKQHAAIRAGQQARFDTLHALILAIEAEYPAEVAAEEALWGKGAADA